MRTLAAAARLGYASGVAALAGPAGKRGEMQPDGYRIVRTLGHGGMATVYLAVQDVLERHVALKILDTRLQDDRALGERFLREARILGTLSHPHIIAVHEVGIVDDRPFMAMEYLPQGSLGEIDLPLSAVRVSRILLQIAAALEFAHARGFVHRDVKPHNILLRDGDSVVLADFGIAKPMALDALHTEDGTVLGTPGYMSPEQVRGLELDGRSDFYSLGVVAYQLLTGELPFVGPDRYSTGIKHLSDPVPRLPHRVAAFQSLIEALLDKRMQPRPASVSEVQALLPDLGEHTLLLGAPISGRLRAQRAPRWPLVILALLVAAGLAFAWQRLQDAAPPPAVATGTPAAEATTLAVLPFRSLSADSADNLLADGLAEDVLNALATSPRLRVSGRTSSFAFRGELVDIAVVRRQLGVDRVLEGSVRREEDTVTVTVQLVDTATGFQLWSTRLSEPVQRSQRLTTAIRDGVLQALTLSPPAKATKDAALAADAGYLELIARVRSGTAEGLADADRQLTGLVASSPHPEPIGLLVQVILDRQARGDLDTATALQRASALVAQAEQMDPLSPRTRLAALSLRAARGGVLTPTQRAFALEAVDDREIAELERLLQDAPSLAQGWSTLCALQQDRGRIDEARRACDRAVTLDPLEPRILLAAALVRGRQGDREATERLLRQGIATQPSYPDFYRALAQGLMSRGRYAEAHGVASDCVAATSSKTCLLQIAGIHFELGQEAPGMQALEAIQGEDFVAETARVGEQLRQRKPTRDILNTLLRRHVAVDRIPKPHLEHLGNEFLADGEWREALRMYRLAAPDIFALDADRAERRHVLSRSRFWIASYAGYAAGRAGDGELAQTLLRRALAIAETYPPNAFPYDTDSARALLLLGRRDEAFARLQELAGFGWSSEVPLETLRSGRPDPTLDALRELPAWRDLRERLRERNRIEWQAIEQSGRPLVPTLPDPTRSDDSRFEVKAASARGGADAMP